MIKKFAHDLPHYVSLFGVLVAAVLGFIVFSYDKPFQMAIAFGVAGAYISWGIVHHVIHRDFAWAVLAEYMAIAALGLVTAFSLLLRS